MNIEAGRAADLLMVRLSYLAIMLAMLSLAACVGTDMSGSGAESTVAAAPAATSPARPAGDAVAAPQRGTPPAAAGFAQQESVTVAPELTQVIASTAEYRIGPLDVLDVSVFQVPELSKSVHVSAAGHISLPLIGTVEAAGKTVSQLEAEVAAKLAADYLQSPQVSIFITDYNSQRITLDGAVNKPGVYPLSGPTTLMQVIANAGGLSELADSQSLMVFRTVDGRKSAAVFDLNAIRAGRSPDPPLQGGDVVVVEASGVKTALSAVKDVIPVIGVFRWLVLL